MTRNHSAGGVPTIPKTSARGILPLPEDVVAQIKSATAITSLNGVVLELLKNSLDAKATKIEATVDFARGGCTVEDDGLGISPLEFREGGGLGTLYCTSKYYASETLLGRNGTFLASLGAMSLLTITSRHHDYRSHNSITFHHAKAIERQLPASVNHEVHGKHGARVTVRNLFGNLPVRVKQRSVALEQKAEQDRLWEGLKRDITGLLLSWRGGVTLKARDGDNRVVLNFNTSNSGVAAQGQSRDTVKTRSAQLTAMLNVLTQADYISFDDWASWVPASASTSSLSIKGAISLDPAPSKHAQFISLGVRPLSANSGHNELYDEVNRLFGLSSFGNVEDDAEVNDLEKIRRQTDKRFKNDGYTTRQLKARKDVDRHPVFYLRISLKDINDSKLSEDQLVDDEARLQTVMEILSAMITQWLSVHHFRPRQPRRKRARLGTASTSLSESTEGDTLSVAESQVASLTRTGDGNVRQFRTPTASFKSTIARCKRTQSTQDDVSQPLEHRAFAQWSRIKSGKAQFFDNMLAAPKSKAKTILEALPNDPQRRPSSHERVEGFANLDIAPVAQGALSLHATGEQLPTSLDEVEAADHKHDDTIMWTDPSTKKTYLLNARTGCVVPDLRLRPSSDSAAPSFAITRNELKRSLRLAPRSAGAVAAKTPFLDNVLQTWDNPIFKPSEQRIQQISLEESSLHHGGHKQSNHHCSRINIDKAFKEAYNMSFSRLSKEGLQHAGVIAQVDKKFILVKIRRLVDPGSSTDTSSEILVLIDQHAADERIQVEALLQELCVPLGRDHGLSGYQSKLGHCSQVASTLLDKPVQFTISNTERTHFTIHAVRFAAWGILFDVLTAPSSTSRPGTSGKTQYILSVTTLPPAIFARCKSDPQILISFLRSTVWKYTEDRHLPPLLSTSSSTSNDGDWVRRLATCPPGLIDLINSRACRSAIMFNDELSPEECTELVRKLAACTFPFMCAHGRPSMVPLVDLGNVGEVLRGHGGEHQEHGNGNGNGKDFVSAWKTWRRDM